MDQVRCKLKNYKNKQGNLTLLLLPPRRSLARRGRSSAHFQRDEVEGWDPLTAWRGLRRQPETAPLQLSLRREALPRQLYLPQ